MQLKKFTPVKVRATGQIVEVWNHMNDMNVICVDKNDAYLFTLEELEIPKRARNVS